MNSNLALQDNTEISGLERNTLPESAAPETTNTQDPKPTLRSMRAAAEITAIRQALEETGWNRKRAAQLLSISYRGLLYKLRQHSIMP
jgi:two-component system, NtrC family, response regulator AtoC